MIRESRSETSKAMGQRKFSKYLETLGFARSTLIAIIKQGEHLLDLGKNPRLNDE